MPTLIMDKPLPQPQALERLAESLLPVEEAARMAHEPATHAENIAENEHDTLGLEVATLVPPDPRLPRLYTFRRCPYAMRARMALLQAGRAFDAVEVSLRDKPASLLALSPKATVPVLHLADGRVIDESWDIMRWAFAARDAQGWWARAQSPANLDLVQRNDGEFKHHLDRWKYPQRYANDTLTPDAHRDRALDVLLQPLEARLRDAPFLGGATPCAADLAVMPFVRKFAAVAPAWFATLALPSVRAWLHGWLVSPLFEACMVKLPAVGAHRFPPVPTVKP